MRAGRQCWSSHVCGSSWPRLIGAGTFYPRSSVVCSSQGSGKSVSVKVMSMIVSCVFARLVGAVV